MTQKATVTRNTEKVSTGPNIKVMRFRVNTKNILNAHKLKSEANADKPNKFQEGRPLALQKAIAPGWVLEF